jgi:hypothetical protein
MLEDGVGQRGEAGSGIEGTVRTHAEVWIAVVVARVEARWLSKVGLQMRMLEGKHLRSGAAACAGAGVRLGGGGDGDGPDVAGETGAWVYVAGAKGEDEAKSSSKTGRGGAVARPVEEDQAQRRPVGLQTGGPEVCCWGRAVEEAKHVDMCRSACSPT